MRTSIMVNAPFWLKGAGIEMACTCVRFSIVRYCLALLSLFVLFQACIAQVKPADCGNGTTTDCGNNSTCVTESGSSVCQCDSLFFTPTGANTDCRGVVEADPQCASYDIQCVFCGSNFQGPCMKCVDLITVSGGCVDECSGGFSISVLNYGNETLSTRICEESSSDESDSLPTWAVIFIVVVACAILIVFCIVVAVFSIFYLGRSSSGQFEVEDNRRRPTHQTTVNTNRSSSFEYQRQKDPNGFEKARASSQFTGHENPMFSDGTDEEVEFLHKLDYLRSQSHSFLRMLNDMRRRLKELPPEAQAAKQYRNVMRDVTRLLYLLNKKPSAVQMPPDGTQLLNWSEQILHRYLASQGQAPRSPPQQMQQHPSNRISGIGPQDETQF